MKRLSISALVVLLWSASVHANLPESYGYGAPTIGFSGAGVALVNDWTSTYYNMAGLAAPSLRPDVRKVRIRSSQSQETTTTTNRQGTKIKLKRSRPVTQNERIEQPRHQMGNSIIYVLPMMNINVQGDSAVAQENARIAKQGLSYAMLNVGIVFDFRTLMNTPKNIPIRLGVALALNLDGSLSRLTDLSQKVYDFRKLGRNPQRISNTIGLGAQVWKERISIGLGVTNLAKGEGKAFISNVNLDPNNPPQPETKVDVKGFSAPQAGIQYRHPLSSKSSFSAGVAYRGEVFLSSDIDVDATLFILGLTTTSQTRIITFYTPHIFVGGFGYIYKNYKFMADIEYQMWSKFPLSETRQKFEQAPGFKDIIFPRLGVEYPIKLAFLRKLRVRGRNGYALQPAFTPDQSGESNYLDNTKHIFSFGLSMLMPKNAVMKHRSRLDFAFQYQLWASRTSTKTVQDPLPDGTNQPDYTYGGNLFLTALGVSLKF